MLAREQTELRKLDTSTPEGIYNIILAETDDADLADRVRAEVLAQRRLSQAVKEHAL